MSNTLNALTPEFENKCQMGSNLRMYARHSTVTKPVGEHTQGLMYPGVELRLYRYVVMLAEVLNFTRAAARLHVAQPALSRQIRQLEEYLGAKLFERNKREVQLTAAGEAFTAEARLTLFHADRAVQGARAAKGQYRGPWSIGYSPLIDLRILSKVRLHLSSTHPAADVRLVSAHTSEQADGLVRGTLTPQHIYKMAARGALPSLRIAGAIRFDPQDLVNWLKTKENQSVVQGGGRRQSV